MGRHNDEQFSKKYGGNGTDHARVDVSKRVQYANDDVYRSAVISRTAREREFQIPGF